MNSTLSKEEILRKHYDSFDVESGWMFDGAVGDVFNAMDEYAKQMMVAIADHINDNGIKWNKADSWGSGKDNTERLIDEYLLYKQKQG